MAVKEESGLYEYVAVATLAADAFKGRPVLDVTFSASVLARYPESERPNYVFPKCLADFGFPTGVAIHINPPPPRFHTFVLTNLDGQRVYGYCCRLTHALPIKHLAAFKTLFGAQIYTNKAYSDMTELPTDFFGDECLIILSSWPMHRAFEQLMISFCNTLDPFEPFTADVVTRLAQILDAAEQSHEVVVGDVKVPFHRPPSKMPQPPLRPLMRSLDPANVIHLFNLLLNEQSIVFVSDDLSLLCACSEAITSLLYPLEWPYAYIPLLPQSLLDVYDAPMPFLVGVPKRSLEVRLPPDHTVMVDLDHNLVTLAESQLRNLEPLPTRHVSRLYDAILKFANLFAYHHPELPPRRPAVLEGVEQHTPYGTPTSRTPSSARSRVNVVTIKTLSALYSSSSGSDPDEGLTPADGTDEGATFSPRAAFNTPPVSALMRSGRRSRFHSAGTGSTTSSPSMLGVRSAATVHFASTVSVYEPQVVFNIAVNVVPEEMADMPVVSVYLSVVPSSMQHASSSPCVLSPEITPDSRIVRTAPGALVFDDSTEGETPLQTVLRRLTPHHSPAMTEPYIHSELLFKAFQSVFVSLLKGYRQFLLLPSDADEPSPGDIFDRASFLAENPEDAAAYLRRFVSTQMFSCFIQDRITHRDSMTDTFDHKVREKNSRRLTKLQLLANYNKRGTLFKQCYVIKIWKKRQIHLDGLMLREFKRSEASEQGHMSLVVGETKVFVPTEQRKYPTDYPFEVHCNKQSFVFCAEDSRTRREWIRIIKAKTSAGLLSRPLDAHPAFVEIVARQREQRRRTVAQYTNDITR